MAKIPRMKQQFRKEKEGTASIETTKRKEETVNPVDPSVLTIITAEWDNPRIMANEVVINAVARMIDEGHPSLLQFIIQRLDSRIRGDLNLYFEEQANLKLLRQLRELGDMIYVKDGRRRR